MRWQNIWLITITQRHLVTFIPVCHVWSTIHNPYHSQGLKDPKVIFIVQTKIFHAELPYLDHGFNDVVQSFFLSLLETNHHYLMSSFNEVAAFTLLKGNPVEFVKYPFDVNEKNVLPFSSGTINSF